MIYTLVLVNFPGSLGLLNGSNGQVAQLITIILTAFSFFYRFEMCCLLNCCIKTKFGLS